MAWNDLISRLTWLFLQPSNVFFILLLFSLFCLWRGKQKRAVITLLGCMVIYALVLFGPLSNWVMVPLEKRFSPYTNKTDATAYSGIIVLAGAERLRLSHKHQQVTLSDAGERLIQAVKLARQFPHLPIIFCGGYLIEGKISEVSIARQFFAEAGIDLSRIRFEGASYNTHTNAMKARKLVKPSETAPWLLVTSAFHMPRAVGAFRTAQIAIQPYPVDYRTELSFSSLNHPDAAGNFKQFDDAVHEWIGLISYRLRGYTNDVFPKLQ